MQEKKIYLKLEDMMKLRDCSNATASRYVSMLKEICGKRRKQKLTIFDYCRIEQIDISEIEEILGLKKNPIEK